MTKLRENLDDTGLSAEARLREQGGSAKRSQLERDYSVEVPAPAPWMT